MKNLVIALVVSLVAASSYAQSSMVRVYGFESTGSTKSVDLSMSGDDADDKNASSNIALNYAYAFGQFQVGLTFGKMTKTVGGDIATGDIENNYQKIGLSAYYNTEADLKETCYFGLHYNMTTYEDADAVTDSGNKTTEISLEYGHRFNVGGAWGMNLTYAPSVMYSMLKSTPNNDAADDLNSTALAWNFLKFDVLF